VRFAAIAKYQHIWPLAWLCKTLEVTRGGFHAWVKRPESERARVDVKLTAAIRTSFAESDRTYGARRVGRDLRDWGHRCGIHRIERLMRNARLVARPRRRRLSFDLGTRIEHTVAPNVLDRQFAATEPTANGRRTLPTFGPRRAGYTSPLFWICFRAGWSVGR
jgi:putative transposase